MFLKKTDNLAIVDFNNNKITHNEMIARIKYLSNNVFNFKNEYVILMMENRPEWIYSFFTIWDKKSVCITVDALSSKDELKYFLEDSKARNIIVSNSNFEIAKQVKESIPDLNIINIDEIEIKEVYDDRELNEFNEDDVAIIMYTSGTTSAPKGVVLTYSNVLHEMEVVKSIKVDEFTNMEQAIALLPFHHIFPLMVTMIYFVHKGYSLVLVNKLTSSVILDALNKNEVTLMLGVPRLYKLFYQSIKNNINSHYITRMLYKMCKKLKNKKLSKIIFKKVHKTFGGHLKALIAGGAKSDPEMIDFFDTLGFMYYEGYGLTETSPVVCATTPYHYKPGTVGTTLKNVEIKIVDEELWVKGPIIMKGYLNKPEKTKEVITEEGWFKTGDLAKIDENGSIIIIGRKNSMIVLSNGKNIDPELLEGKLLNKFKFGVKEVAFLNNNDKLSALVVVDSNLLKSKGVFNIKTFVKDAIEFYNAEVHNYSKILDFKIVEEELPKTRVGKIRRFMLNDIYKADISENKKEVEVLDYNEYKILLEYIEKLKGFKPNPDDKFEIEIGLDSLDLVELIAFIERNFNLKLDEKIILNNNSLRLLSEYIRDNSTGYNKTDLNWKDIIESSKKVEVKQGYLVRILKPILWLFLKIYFRLSIKGKKEIPNKKPCIYIANHESFIDALCLGQLVDNNTYFVAIDLYFKSGFMKYIADNTNILVINIEKDLTESIQKMANVLKQGKNIFVFPEGTRTKDGNISPFKKVFAILAKELDIDIYALKINGAFEAYSRHMKIPRPKHITVDYIGCIKPEGTYEEIVKKCEELYK